MFPKSAQVEVRDKDGEDQQGDAGADAAAFASYFDIDVGEVEDEAIAKDRDAAPIEEDGSDFRRAALQVVDRAIKKEIRDGDSEEEKSKREGGKTQGRAAEEKGEGGDPQEQEGEDVEGELVEGAPVRAGEESHGGGQGAGEEKGDGSRDVGVESGKDAVALEIEKPQADGGDEDGVGGVVVGKRVANEARDRAEQEKTGSKKPCDAEPGAAGKIAERRRGCGGGELGFGNGHFFKRANG